MVTFHVGSVAELWLAGQFSIFNFSDKYLASAWKKIPELANPRVFQQGLMPELPEEQVWSWWYMNSDRELNLPGSDLSYVVLPDLDGDDMVEHQGQIHAISGRDVILLDTNSMNRDKIEELILLERSAPIDPLGGVGWSSGFDGSQELLDHPENDNQEVLRLAGQDGSRGKVYNGILRSTKVMQADQCSHPWFTPPKWRLCTNGHVLEYWPSAVRTSLIHFKEQASGYVFERKERDSRTRAYDRKLFKHHHSSKHWIAFPPFEITENLVMVQTQESIEVFQMGANRSETIYYREKAGQKSIG